MIHSSLAHLGIIDGIKIKQIPKIILKLLRKNLGKNSQEATQNAISTTLGYLIGKSMKSLILHQFSKTSTF